MKIIQTSFFLAIIMIFIASCGNNSNSNNNSNSTNVENQNIDFKELNFDKAVLTQITGIEGTFEIGKKWQDKNGFNILIFTKDQIFEKWKDAEAPDMGDNTAYLKVYHYKSSDEKTWELVRLVQDFSEPCGSPPFGLEFDFCKDDILISDINNNNYSEILFAYHFQCASELSPKIMKLMMLENGEKYPIRGESYADYGFQIVGGKTNIGDEFNKAPDGFEDYALKNWKKIQYSLSFVETDRIKFADFWDNFIKIIEEKDKDGLKKISKVTDFDNYLFSDIKNNISEVTIDKVMFENNNLAKLELVISGSYCFFTLEQINGEWFIKEFNVAG